VRRRPRCAAAIACVVAGLVLARAAPSAAQEDGIRGADRPVLQLSAGALVRPASSLVDVAVGRFVGDRLELGIRQEIGLTGAGTHDWHLATTPFADLFLAADPKWPLTPFVGVSAGALYDDRRLTGTVGPEAGVALFVSDALFLSVRYQFRWAAERVDGVGHDDHLALLAVGLLLGGDDAELARAEASAARAEEAAAKAERAVDRLEESVGRLERAVDELDRWFKQQLRK
jgi:hypothetical protein